MKIFKNLTLDESFIQGDVMPDMNINETIITKNHQRNGYANFIVHRKKKEGTFSYEGGFNELSRAIEFARTVENPTLINSGVQFIELGGNQKMVIFYGQYESDVEQYLSDEEEISGDPIKLCDSGLFSAFISTKSKTYHIKKDTERIFFEGFVKMCQESLSPTNYILLEDRIIPELMDNRLT
jgi:hypothetical protein